VSESTRRAGRPVAADPENEGTLAVDELTTTEGSAEPRADAAMTEIMRVAGEAADRVAEVLVAEVLQDAEEAAAQRLGEARAQAAAIQRQAEIDAAAHAEQIRQEAERVRLEADEYVANVRLAADAYASQRQDDALERSRRLLEEAELEARSIREVEAVRIGAVVPSEEDELEAAAHARGRVRRGIELTSVGAVMSRDISVYLRSWRSTTFSAIVEPIIFLLAFGLGFGALISHVRGVDYIQFVATGVVATTVVFSSAFPGMFQTFVKREFQRIYDALLATPVNVDELVTAEVLWISIRTGIYSIAPVVVGVGFGLRPGWGVVLVPFIAFLSAYGLASFGVTMAAMMKSIANFNYIISGVLTPLILLAGAYFPVDTLPRWAFILDQFNPLYHCVTLVRSAVWGFNTGHDLYHVGVLLFFGLLMWRIAITKLRPRLID
jgi:lipooligosaccharide transport system permease protein